MSDIIKHTLPKKSDDGEMTFPYKGWVEFELPSFEDRADLLRSIHIGVPVEGKTVERDEYDKIKEWYKICKTHIKKMSVFKGKKEFKTIEEISRDNAASFFIVYVGQTICNSVDLGE